jgi:hypothetical protein
LTEVAALVALALSLGANPAAPSPSAPKPTKVAVSELEAGYGADPKLAHTLSSLLTGELRKRPLAITSQEDIKSLLGLQRQKQLVGCSDTSCLSEIGGALGVDQMVTGSLGHVGESYLLDLRAIDVRKATVLKEASRRLRTTDQDALLDAITELAAELYPGPVAPSPVPEAALTAPEPPKRRSLIGPIAVGAAGAVAAIAGGIVWLDAVKAGQAQTVDGSTVYGLTYAQAKGRNEEAAVGVAFFVSGIVVGLAGLGWGLFR